MISTVVGSVVAESLFNRLVGGVEIIILGGLNVKLSPAMVR